MLVLALVEALVIAAVAVAAGAPDGRVAEAAAFDRAFAAYQGWFTGERDERGTRYEHWRYTDASGAGTRRIDVEIDYARAGRGRDIALLRRDRNARPGFSLDHLHEPGSPDDLVLVGDRYRRPVDQGDGLPPAPLARTLWIARPTTLADSNGWDPCATGGTSLF